MAAEGQMDPPRPRRVGGARIKEGCVAAALGCEGGWGPWGGGTCREWVTRGDGEVRNEG